MPHLLYCVYGYADRDEAERKIHGHLYWFNPRMICMVKSYAEQKLARIQTADTDCIWCELGEWETLIDEIHASFSRPKDVRIQEVVVMK